MAVSRAAIEAVGLLDEELFAYVEDVDWSLRVRAAGFEVLFVPDARAWHAVGGSTGGEYGVSTHTLYYGVRNTVVVCERHAPLGRVGTFSEALDSGDVRLRAASCRNRRVALEQVPRRAARCARGPPRDAPLTRPPSISSGRCRNFWSCGALYLRIRMAPTRATSQSFRPTTSRRPCAR